MTTAISRVRQPAPISRVYKYSLLPLGDWISLHLPDGAVPLCVQVQDGEPCLWARVNVDAPPVLHHFRIAGTGHALDDKVGRYTGTFQLHGGALVFHVFADAFDRESAAA